MKPLRGAKQALCLRQSGRNEERYVESSISVPCAVFRQPRRRALWAQNKALGVEAEMVWRLQKPCGRFTSNHHRLALR